MKFIYGRYFFNKFDRVINCTKVYAAFMSQKLAEEYGESRMSDIAPNTVDFIFDGNKLLFYSNKGNKNSWEELDKTYVYNCTNDTEDRLTDYMVSEKDIISAIEKIICESEY